ncbi:anti-sigma factor [Ancylobacter mangrovi]|uniref:anti-sigma factor n=1 Tax=Ancylobacter mangrovi TaxID=2972472 RepID=UPI002161CEE7|nr:anti-sigma factor [Ancylobacter mangrovi]MCS0505092.1 anti-sigma factor [Ancylobacter mangrovi]
MSIDPDKITDEEITAFLDGELPPEEAARLEALAAQDPRVAERIEFLARASLPFGDAFAPLLDAAPRDRLAAALAATPSPAPARNGWLTRRSLVGAMAASLLAGIVADRALERLTAPAAQEEDEASEWRKAVAGYMSLYTRETLSGPTPSPQSQRADFAFIEQRLGLSLSPEAVALPSAEYRRAQILSYDGRPLVQIAYLDPETGPMALCITAHPEGGRQPMESERRRGMNVVYWSSADHAFMLIGHAGPERMKDLATGLAERLAA